MARRYVFSSGGVATAASLRAQVPSATVTESGGWIEVLVPEAAVGAFDAALPASPVVSEPIGEGSPVLLARPVRADLLDGLAPLVADARARLTSGTLAQARADLGALIQALDGLTADAGGRGVDPILRTGP